ncbi:PQQ-binding-like beta-propeller repeat protein [Streptomyces sp. NPDC059009]|uniref:outer membrane protein assembly factor BamB family protein n=1 Tax=Streptomyces sp. NPDC059009 TaxID=3346694 RepID=UPI0036BFE72E
MAAPTGGLEELRDADPARIGAYSLLARLREGASAVEYLGRDRDGDTLSVRAPRPDLTGSPALLRAFRSEGELAARAAGPWVAPVREAAKGRLVTAYRPALTLAAAVDRHGPLPEHTVRLLGAALAEVLGRLRPLVPVHQGLAPHTVLLAADGPLLAGFGPLAAATSVDMDTAGTGLRLTLGFLTPEQVARRAPGPASDVFVLGLLLVYAATGGSPFGPSASAAPDAIATAEPDLGGVPERLRPLLARCLDKDPARRPEPEVIAAGLAPGGVAGLAREGWLPGALVADLARQAAVVMARETPGEGQAPTALAAPDPTATLVGPDPAKTAVDGERQPAPTARRVPLVSRRTLLAAGAGMAAGAAGAVPLARGFGGERAPAKAVAAATRPARQVAGTAPTALWHYKAVEPTTNGVPLVWRDEVLVIPNVGNTVGVDVRTGKVRWTKPFSCDAGPVAVGDDLLLAPTLRGLVRFSARTGTVRDTTQTYGVGAFVAQEAGRLWFTHSGKKGGQYLVCYDYAEGDEVWRTELPKDYPGDVRVAVGEKSVYVQRFTDPTGMDAKGKARFFAVDRESGDERWERSYGKVRAKDYAWVTPQGVLCADEDAKLKGYDLESGKHLWTYKNELGSTTTAPRALLARGDSLYFADRSRVVACANARDGKRRWVSGPPDHERVTNDYTAVAAGPSGTPLYHLGWGAVRAIDPEDGRSLWVFQAVSEAEDLTLGWQVFSGTKTAVFARDGSKHYYALPVG